MKKPIRSEHEEQVLLFKMIDLYSSRYPGLLNAFAIPNGGKRNIVTAKKLKAEGVKAGYPDVGIDIAARGYHGLRIELKRSDGGKGLSADQKIWRERLLMSGYCFRMASGWQEAWEIIKWYFNIKE